MYGQPNSGHYAHPPHPHPHPHAQPQPQQQQQAQAQPHAQPHPHAHLNVQPYPYAHETPLGFSPQRGPQSQNSLGSASSSSFSMLRVKVADEYRIPPPVSVQPNIEVLPETTPQEDFNFDFEQGILEGSAASQGETGGNDEQFMDPWLPFIERYKDLGYTQDDVFMALAVKDGDNDEEVVDFCQHYQSLTGMGFSPSLVVGALLLHKTDVHVASDTLLAISNRQGA